MSMRPGAVAVLLLVVALTGCTAAIPGPTPDDATGEQRRDGTVFNVTVREVVDGDTVAVAFPDGSVEDVRLLGVDAPEAGGESSPDEFEGIPDTDAGRAHLRTWGERASAFAESRLEVGETVRIEVDETADRRDGYGRLLVYLYDDGALFNRLLLEGGYARLYDTTFERRGAFADAEAAAMRNETGLWGFGP